MQFSYCERYKANDHIQLMCKLYANVFKCLYSCAYVNEQGEGHAHGHVRLVNLAGLIT